MYKLLLPIFSAVCGENPQHVWSPGGQPLPCCQRCAGLYVGALVATALHLWLRPRISKGFLQLHALFLLQLGLFVFPYVPTSPVLRSISGSLFGFGVVAFLAPAILDWCPPISVSLLSARVYVAGLAGCLGLVPAAAEWGGRPGALVLMCLVLASAVVLAALACANLARCFLAFASRLSRIINPLAPARVRARWRQNPG
jgi:uncharacterized membrane protein